MNILNCLIADGKYFESRNEVVKAFQRLLDHDPFPVNDTLGCSGHVLNANTCDEAVVDFCSREDQVQSEFLE